MAPPDASVPPAPGPVGAVGTPGASQQPAVDEPAALSSLGAWSELCKTLAITIPKNLKTSRRLDIAVHQALGRPRHK